MELRRLTLEPWKVFRLEVKDTQHFDWEEPDMDTDLHQSKRSDTDSHQRERLDPDLQQSEKSDSDLHQSKARSGFASK